MLDLWYQDVVMYELDVETFHDSNGDGVGDFRGLIWRMDYLAGLGVNCLWLMPFFPTPNKDDGYDVADYYGIDARLGTLGDFVDFMHLARERGIRVLIELAVNHTSDQHRWFQLARRDRNSPYRDYYIWSEQEPENVRGGTVFPPRQDRTWTYDEKAQAWYFHRFFPFQPDLNLANPAVRDEIRKIMGYWLALGVSGFRIDAAPFVIEHGDMDRTLRELREFLTCRRGDGMLLAEANVPAKEIPQYFDGGTKVHMLFNFLVNQRLAVALARGEASPLIEQLRELPPVPPSGQWANFLRNHDEWDLGRLTDEERKDVFAEFGPQKQMQIFNRGLRRRLASLLDGDRKRIELAFSILLTLPGIPVLYYGDEIGMGEDLELDGRFSVRTAMQWSGEENAGFSTASADQLVRPVISEGPYGYERINVADQRRDENSLLTWVQRALRIRRECPEFGRGEWRILDSDDPAILILRFEWESGAVIAVHNFSNRNVKARIDLEDSAGEHLVELLGEEAYAKRGQSQEVELQAYGYRWYRIVGLGWKLT